MIQIQPFKAIRPKQEITSQFVLNRLANNFIRILFFLKYNDVTNAFKAYKKKTLDECNPIISQHFNINAELCLKSIIRGYRYKQFTQFSS